MEILESRMMLACSLVQSGNTLQVLGDSRPNIVDIYDNGEGEVDVSCTGKQGIEAEVFENITKISVLTFGGNDNVNYTFTGDVITSSSIDIVTDKGTDVVNLYSEYNVDGQLNFSVDLGSSNDTFEATFLLDIYGRLGLAVNGNKGNDTIEYYLEGYVPNILNVSLDGGTGNDEITSNTILYNAFDEEIASLLIALNGNKGKDHAFANIYTQVEAEEFTRLD